MKKQKTIAIVGAQGNMGRRYAAIVRYLGHNVREYDQEDDSDDFCGEIPWHDGIIVATPTDTHAKWVRRMLGYDAPVLVEKPLSTNLDEALGLCHRARNEDCCLSMVNQYRYLIGKGDVGPTVYDYWNHGRDGLAWDCISVVALAEGSLELREKSPIWTCVINGRKLSPATMDHAYIEMVRSWIERPASDLDYIEAAHRKVQEYIDGRWKGR